MKRKILIPIFVIGALAVATAFGVVAYGSARAATAKARSAALSGNLFAGYEKGFGGGPDNQYLADALGITVDELNTARQKANDAALDQAVQAGLITQAQADEIRTRGSAFPFGGGWSGWFSQKGIDYDALLADALGISVEKLQAAYVQAHNAQIDQAVTDGRLTQEQADLLKGQYALYSSQNFQSAMLSAFEGAVKQAVADGVITQAQADQILQNGNGLGFPGFKDFAGPGGFGRGHGEGFGPHGPRGGETPGGNPPAAPTATPSSGG